MTTMSTNTFSEPNKQQGMTIMEVMIAITISLVLLSGVSQIFISSKQTYRFNDELARLQENGRAVLDMLAHDIRMTGYQGCADPEDVSATIVADSAPTDDLLATALQGSIVDDSGWNPAAPSGLPTTVEDENGHSYTLTSLPALNTDVLITQFASADGAQTTSTASTVTGDIQLPANTGGFAAGETLAIANCGTVDIFKASEVTSDFVVRHAASASGTTYNTSNSLSTAYASGAKVMRFESNAYFVAPARTANGSVKTNSRGATVNALYRADIDGNLIALVEGVDSLQIQYGQRVNNTNLQYVSADDASLNMQNVDSVRIGVLMSTIQALTDADDTATYTVAGTAIQPQGTAGATATYPLDRRIRRVFSETVNLRNRQ
jgi:type IV pilus assembly protein PilW